MIESHGSINAAFIDTCRTQDTIGYEAYNTPWFNYDWRYARAERYRMIAMTSPNRIVDTDGLGANSNPGVYNVPCGEPQLDFQGIGCYFSGSYDGGPANNGESDAETCIQDGGAWIDSTPDSAVTIYNKEIDLMIGYGRPIIYWLPHIWLQSASDGPYSAHLKEAEPHYLAQLRAYAQLPKATPVREIDTANWTTKLTYPDGSIVSGTLSDGFTIQLAKQDSIVIPATSNSLTYIGRWAELSSVDTVAKVAITGGQRLRFSFTGTSLSMQFVVSSHQVKPQISWSVDGGYYNRAAVITPSITLASGLTNTTHTFDCWVEATAWNNLRWTSHDGIWITSITLDQAASINPWPTNTYGKMLVIGDSIAEGQLVLNDGLGINAANESITSISSRDTFHAILGDQLGLEVWTHAFGGSGFGFTMQPGAIPPTHINYPFKMSGIPKTDPKFDIILIEAINNDSDDITVQYESLISLLKNDHPNAKILCLGNLLGPADSSYVQTAASTTGCIYVSPTAWSYSHGNQGHPDMAGHVSIANYLATIIAPLVPQGNEAVLYSGFIRGGTYNSPQIIVLTAINSTSTIYYTLTPK